jgi:hypothetical protein
VKSVRREGFSGKSQARTARKKITAGSGVRGVDPRVRPEAAPGPSAVWRATRRVVPRRAGVTLPVQPGARGARVQFFAASAASAAQADDAYSRVTEVK